MKYFYIIHEYHQNTSELNQWKTKMNGIFMLPWVQVQSNP